MLLEHIHNKKNTLLMPTRENITLAVQHIRQGKLVGLPTETVYGLAADAENEEALSSLFTLKGRPTSHPVIVHLSSQEIVSEWATAIPAAAKHLGEAFWPGPLTMVLHRSKRVSNSITGGQDTVAIRIPAHPVMHAVLKEFGGGLAAPSANRFGKVSPTLATHVREEFGDKLDLILDGGSCSVGVESTIIGFHGNSPTILRPGMITADMIEAALQPLGWQLFCSTNKNTGIRISGNLNSHYAPNTPVSLFEWRHLIKEAHQHLHHAERLGLITHSQTVPEFLEQDSRITCVSLSDNPATYAHQLYATLRQLDSQKLHKILIERVPGTTPWDAITDRLQRASQKK